MSLALDDCSMKCMASNDCMREFMELDDDMDEGVESESAPKNTGKFRSMRKNRKKTVKQIGSANAARVSRGSEVDTWKGLTKKSPVRNPAEHITISVVLYFTVANGVPSE